MFQVSVAISGLEKYSFELLFNDLCYRETVNIKKTIQCTFVILFWVGNFNARYFFGSKISGLCIFRHVYFKYPPWDKWVTHKVNAGGNPGID